MLEKNKRKAVYTNRLALEYQCDTSAGVNTQ